MSKHRKKKIVSRIKYNVTWSDELVFIGQCSIPAAKELSKTKPPPKGKFFLGSSCSSVVGLQTGCGGTISGAAGHARYVPSRTKQFSTCWWACVYAREVWHRMLRPSVLEHLIPEQDARFPNWWYSSRKRVSKEQRKDFDTFVALICWCVWKARNRRVFNNAMAHASQLSS
jgi:hypothetical protein